MNPNFNNLWEFIKWFCWEMLKTFSKQPSFFCSKRVERFGIFLNANILLDICVHWLLVHDKMDMSTSVVVYAAQMVYAGYQTKQIFNEKPKTTVEADSKEGTNVEITENK